MNEADHLRSRQSGEKSCGSLGTVQEIERLTWSFRPTVPVNELVFALNQIYHEHVAGDYDRRHPEISLQLPPIWRKMIQVARQTLRDPTYRILNFGCGTGFEAAQLLVSIPSECIEEMVCIDPSPQMLALCRKKIRPRFPGAVFLESVDNIDRARQYNVLATNSLIHHLPDYRSTLGTLDSALARDAVWLAGHEPSRRYYLNPECLAVYLSYRRYALVRKLISPSHLGFRLRRLFGQDDGPASRTATQAYRRGLFERRPGARTIARLVDIHVAHSAEEVRRGRGLDQDTLRAHMAARWQQVWGATYSFMGPVWEGALAGRWRRAAARLAEMYPMDGANMSSVWRHWTASSD